MKADPDAVKVAIASLLRMIDLMGAEMLVGRYRRNLDVFEFCARAMLFAEVEGVSRQATAEGVALAHELIEPVLAQLRERVRAVRALDKSEPAPARHLN